MHFYLIKTPFRRNSVLLTGHHAVPVVTLLLVLPMLPMWHYITSDHQVQHQCYLRDIMLRQWWSGDLPRVLRVWESVFYSQAFFTLHSFLLLQGFPGTGSSNSELARLHADLRNIASTQLLVWITTIHKRFICGRFYLRARDGHPRNIKLHGKLVLQSISFTETLFLKYSPLTGFATGKHVTSVLS